MLSSNPIHEKRELRNAADSSARFVQSTYSENTGTNHPKDISSSCACAKIMYARSNIPPKPYKAHSTVTATETSTATAEIAIPPLDFNMRRLYHISRIAVHNRTLAKRPENQRQLKPLDTKPHNPLPFKSGFYRPSVTSVHLLLQSTIVVIGHPVAHCAYGATAKAAHRTRNGFTVTKRRENF